MRDSHAITHVSSCLRMRTPTRHLAMAAVLVHCCPICDSTTSTLAEWFSHLRSSHSRDPSFRVTCGIDGCNNTYSKFSSLNTHVYRHHKQRMCGSSIQSKSDSTIVQPDLIPEPTPMEDLPEAFMMEHENEFETNFIVSIMFHSL